MREWSLQIKLFSFILLQLQITRPKIHFFFYKCRDSTSDSQSDSDHESSENTLNETSPQGEHVVSPHQQEVIVSEAGDGPRSTEEHTDDSFNEEEDASSADIHEDDAVKVTQKEVRTLFWRMMNEGNRGQGFSLRDIKSLIKFLTNEDMPAALLGFQTLADYLRFDDEMVRDKRQSFWHQKKVGHELDIEWQHRDGLEAVRTLLEEAANAPGFSLSASVQWTEKEQRQRVYSNIASGEWWEEVQVSSTATCITAWEAMNNTSQHGRQWTTHHSMGGNEQHITAWEAKGTTHHSMGGNEQHITAWEAKGITHHSMGGNEQHTTAWEAMNNT